MKNVKIIEVDANSRTAIGIFIKSSHPTLIGKRIIIKLKPEMVLPRVGDVVTISVKK